MHLHVGQEAARTLETPLGRRYIGINVEYSSRGSAGGKERHGDPVVGSPLLAIFVLDCDSLLCIIHSRHRSEGNERASRRSFARRVSLSFGVENRGAETRTIVAGEPRGT